MTADEFAQQIFKLFGMPKTQDDLLYMLQFAFTRGQVQEVLEAQMLTESVRERIAQGAQH